MSLLPKINLQCISELFFFNMRQLREACWVCEKYWLATESLWSDVFNELSRMKCPWKTCQLCLLYSVYEQHQLVLLLFFWVTLSNMNLVNWDPDSSAGWLWINHKPQCAMLVHSCVDLLWLTGWLLGHVIVLWHVCMYGSHNNGARLLCGLLWCGCLCSISKSTTTHRQFWTVCQTQKDSERVHYVSP